MNSPCSGEGKLNVRTEEFQERHGRQHDCEEAEQQHIPL